MRSRPSNSRRPRSSRGDQPAPFEMMRYWLAMSLTRVLARHLSVGLLTVTTLSLTGRAAGTPEQDATSRFFITYQGARIGAETVTVTRESDAIRISSSGQVLSPLNLSTARFELVYSLDWQPRRLTIDAQLRSQVLSIGTTFGLTTAISDVVQGERKGSVTHEISARSVVLPPSYFGAYEALAPRLGSMPAGTRFPIYVPPEGEITGTINRVVPRRIVNPSGATELNEYDITLNRPSAPITVLVSVDARGRLAKVVFGDQGFAAIREDISTVMSREERVRNPGDSDAFIPATGFSLAATVTKPAGTATGGRVPAIVLVSPPNGQTRDETRYGFSIFGHLAGQLAEAGMLVVRFDQRGVGQSGGRVEHAGIEEYAGDVLSVITWLRQRRDVDQDRIVVLSHAEGAAIALSAAARERRIRGVALVAASGMTGRETVLTQQQQSLRRAKGTPIDNDARVSMQLRVIDAVMTGKGWETIPVDVRRQADSPWFRTWLLFDPAVPLRRMDQAVLILHGSLDREMPPSQGDRLEQLSAARRGVPAAGTRRAIVKDVNHLLMTAKTGEPDEYDSLGAQRVSPDLVTALVEWINQSVKAK